MITGTYTHRAIAGGPAQLPNVVAGFYPFGPNGEQPRSYADVVRACRWYYQNDPHISAVVQRIADLAASGLVNTDTPLSGGDVPDKGTYELYDAIAAKINDVLFSIIIGYLVDGMVVPQYELQRVMGTRLTGVTSRTRYLVPTSFWLRDPLQFELHPSIFGAQPIAYLRIPQDDITFVQSKGVFPDGRKDIKRYRELVERFPEYVDAIRRGETSIPYNGYIIYRNLLPQATYPQPYLQPTLGALARKYALQRLDAAVSARMVEAFRHAKVGNDTYPADDGDIEALRTELERASNDYAVFNIVTNHTVDIQWVIPDYRDLLDPNKYEIVDRDIAAGLGFPRILLLGETERSNSADNQVASLGVLSFIRHIQRDIIQWVYHVYRDVAEANAITRVPKPEFMPVRIADTNQLLQYATMLFETGILSRATIAGLYGVDYRVERLRREQEDRQQSEQQSSDSPTTTTEGV